MIPTLVINLERDIVRRTAMAARLDGLGIPYAFLKATHGSDLSTADLERYSPRRELAFPRPLMPNEVATGLSHIKAIAEGARLDCDFFCVFEDDTLMTPGLTACLNSDALRALPDFDVLRLFSYPDRWDKPSKTVAFFNDNAVVRMLRPGWGCQGQIYSRHGARKIVASMTTVRAPIDFALYHDCLVSGLKVLEMRPGVVSRDYSMVSSVGDRLPLMHKESVAERAGRNIDRSRRKLRVAISFFRAWGVLGFLSCLSLWR